MMETLKFLTYVKNPANVDDKSLKQFEELQKKYPYCQTAMLLYTFNLFKEDHPQYAVQLKKAAAYASDRRMLKRLINIYKAAHPKPVKKPTPPLPAPPKPKQPKIVQPEPTKSEHPEVIQPKKVIPPVQEPVKRVVFKPVPFMEEEKSDDSMRDKLLEIVHKRLAEIAEEHGDELPKREPVKATPPAEITRRKKRVTFTVQSTKHMTRQELIEKFIREEPKISAPRTVFLKPAIPTVQSEMEDAEIVSETLAILYHKQGNSGKSIRVYEKLCLLFPEKSSYFAARIEELKANHQTDNEESES
ncbi:MAG: hypothetical protein ISR57_05050 [Bacteroidales bacterium]|nr:hypothetical protein [Bacteroidota bacterium]MBL6949996.1 hypothetical protein [Bacteroidales bacterium]